MKEKPPRVYADEILMLETKEARRAALEQVPDEIRHLVKFYVADTFAKRNRTKLPGLERRNQ